MFGSRLFKKQSPDTSIVKTYSPMSKLDRIVYGFLILTGLITFLRYAQWWFRSEHIPTNWLTEQYSYLSFIDFGLFSILSFVVFFGLILKIGTWFTTWFMRRPVHIAPAPNLKVAFLTCYVPGNEPIEMLKETLIAMKEAHYQHDTWVLDEGNQDEVKQLSQELGIKYFSRFDKEHYNQSTGPFRKKTKAGNLNSWRNEHEQDYDIVAQVDMDHVPHKDYLTKLLGYFIDPKVGFVGVPQIYKNTENWIARGAAEQTHFYYGPLQQGFYGSHMPFLIGTTHVYRVEAMKSFGGYAPTIAEDYLTGMHFFSHGWKGVYVPEVLAEGLGPVTWTDYFNQQMRWSYGLYEILFKHTHRHIFRMNWKQKINLLFSQMFYFSGLATFLGFTLTSVYLVLGINSTNMNLVEWSMYALPAYFSGFLILLFLHKFYIDPKKEPQFALLGMLLGQAASVIYTVSLIKFIIRKKLTYVVTPKDSNSAQRVSWNVFAFHILILLATILTLEISFITEHDSIVMRFWAVVNVIFLTLILITAYWGSFISMFKWRVKESPLYPLVTDLNYDKYGYVIKNPNKVRILYGLGILAWASTLYGFTQFLSLNPWYWLFFGPVLGIISIHNFLNYGINTFYKKFDIAKHEKLKEEYWQTNRVNLPSVDVFLPVCGEKINILRDTFSSVKRLDYLNMQAYVLDDKGDSEVEVLAKEFGFIYLSRPNKGEMKKAGNLMYGFKHGTGEFYAVFDADFCPHPDFINDLLPYMADEKVGLVQSPHFFEIGNHIHKRAPIEYGSANLQEQFFRTIQVARDRFGGAICAGSNTIYRRSALEKNGGPAQVDHGEDVNTGIDIINLGYKIKYVPVILAKGLSPDTLQSFYKQQNRWASSSTGLLLSGKIFKAKLTFAQKLCYLSGITYYMSQVAYFLLPLQLFLMLGLHADSISVERAAPFIPYMIFSMIILPLFSRKSKPKFGTYLAVMSSVYVHVYTIILRLFGQHAQWVPTNAITSKIERGFLFLNDFSLLFLAAYFFGISLLIYNWNLPLLNGVYLSLMFWMAWNISMHFMYFFQTHRVIHFQKAVEAATHPLLKRDFNFWRVKSYAGLAVIFLSVTSSSVYTLQATGNQVFFAPRSEILAMINKEEITNNLAMINSMVDENTGVLGVAKAEEASDDKLYIEEVLPGDSLTRVYRRIINSFVRDTEVSLSPKEKLVLENYLVVNLPKLKIRQGDVIQVYQSQLADALLIILK